MPATQRTRQRITDLKLRAHAITIESAILRQAWSDNFHLANDHDLGSHLLAQLRDLTAQASTVQHTITQLQEVAPSTPDRAWRALPACAEHPSDAEDVVCILCRQRMIDGASSGLIIGVFPSAAEAMLYAQLREAVAIHDWQPPRLDNRHWVRQGEQVTYTIEMHTIRRPLMQPLTRPRPTIVAAV